MRRALVLTNEAARHPFRASLPQGSSTAPLDDVEPRLSWRRRFFADCETWRPVLKTYCACLLTVSLFIA